MGTQSMVRWLEDVSSGDVAVVGGKNASLGEMIRGLSTRGVRVPGGFAITAQAYRELLDANDLRTRIAAQIDALHQGADLAEVGGAIRRMFLDAQFPPDLAQAVRDAYRGLATRARREDPDVAVRSSATAEDLPEASFAGQQETYLNVRGEQALLEACKRCYASLFTDRAISYREHHRFDHLKVALSIGVQQMVRSDRAGAGVMFSIDTDSGFPRVVLINASWGLGESVVAGKVDPDEYLVFKPLLANPEATPVISKKVGGKRSKIIYSDSGGDPTRAVETSAEEQTATVLTDQEITRLARWATAIEDHYGRAMDMEWAKDGETGEIYLVQARPETVHVHKEASTLRSYRLTGHGDRLVSGLAIGDAIAAGKVCNLRSAAEIDRFQDGAVLVTGATDPDWEPIMKRAAAIVTDHGGRTSHAAIVSRELGLAAIVGTGDATSRLTDGQEITVSCAEGDEGHIYAGILDYDAREIDLAQIPTTRTQVMLNLAEPAAAFRWWRLPADGVGLARMEFIVNNHIKIHPMALVRFAELDDDKARRQITELTRGHEDKTEFFVEHLAYGIARIAAAWWPKPVIVRMSDFKTNEYARLIGGEAFEPAEENPMLGWRGASRYYSEDYRQGFALECRALRRVRDAMGLTNTVVMIPFCRTPQEADHVLETMAEQGLIRGRNGLQVYVMVEIPSNVLLAAEFAERFDGFSIGSNDLTQLTLGVDRDSERLAPLFNERDPAVTKSIEAVISAAHDNRRKVGLCGQRPSDDPEFARLLVRAGIDSVSVSPDSFLGVKDIVAAAERAHHGQHRPGH
ncbi:phosphoenolpyruvate synthase [Micromonospora globispora]|uniref:Phosphoenolpyruvate synthase n=1 Tax=Micromonospora globispora TaxID=1450148 RepID=A0A317K699_9ACTN|nr:phosphoenolpyruvate synthase [Micromonospora globispora]PWU48535.1 phosphoenolpyruvate synthase [Micromonospora globispora]RQW99817.1 phosphoenolpyruvate synthase [Micromonospora globispora]